jgi:hypothetical protein
MKLGQTIEALMISSRQRTIPESHMADDVLKIIQDIADKCRKLVLHKKLFPTVSCVCLRNPMY